MRGEEQHSAAFFSYLRLEERIPVDHPLRTILGLVDASLAELSRAFDKLDAETAVPRFLRNGCCGRCCCRRSTRRAPSGPFFLVASEPERRWVLSVSA
jgi:hypothetical protein